MKRKNAVFKTTDKVISKIFLPPATKIKVEIAGNSVLLFVGPRDWQWDYETGELVGTGTRMA